jgi:hypothetical protein
MAREAHTTKPKLQDEFQSQNERPHLVLCILHLEVRAYTPRNFDTSYSDIIAASTSSRLPSLSISKVAC